MDFVAEIQLPPPPKHLESTETLEADTEADQGQPEFSLVYRVSAKPASLSKSHNKQKAEFRAYSGSCLPGVARCTASVTRVTSPAHTSAVAAVSHAWSSAGDITLEGSKEVC